MTKSEIGILLQGRVSNWLPNIIQEYKMNFPDANILLSTWDTENTTDVDCEIVRSEMPPPTPPHNSSTNFQIIGVKNGLKKLDAEIILKCRTDQFIHNKDIFRLYKENCPIEKIMVTDIGSKINDEYRVSDFCQIARKKILESYWNEIPIKDGMYPISSEVYLTKNYVQNIKNDNRPWNEIYNKYFHYMDYNFDFQIEFEKLAYNEKYSRQWNSFQAKI